MAGGWAGDISLLASALSLPSRRIEISSGRLHVLLIDICTTAAESRKTLSSWTKPHVQLREAWEEGGGARRMCPFPAKVSKVSKVAKV